MFRSARTPKCEVNLPRLPAFLLALALLGSFSFAQSNQPETATVQGSVRDSQARILSGVRVHLRSAGGTLDFNTSTDSNGAYRLTVAPGETYTLSTEIPGHAPLTVGPFSLAPHELKQIDLRLQVEEQNHASIKTSAAPEYFDEPPFTVAGVTDAPHPGGHGSDAVLRNSESLAKATASLGQPPTTPPNATSGGTLEKSLQNAAHTPNSFQANFQLGRLLLAQGKTGDAAPYLKRAAELSAPGEAQHDRAEVHHLLADAQERLGHPLEAVEEYQQAAQLEPSENNLFDWGSELLVHRAYEPALEVYQRGTHLFPNSVRMLVGHGVAEYSQGSYDKAAQDLFQASDLNPQDPEPYLFLGKMQAVDTTPSHGFSDKLARFLQMQPDNALANYYYAISLQREHAADPGTLTQVESLLRKAVRLDPKLAAAYLQLGILSTQKKNLPDAVAEFQKAVAADPHFEEAHYRLAQAYERTGDKQKAKQELMLYEQAKKQTSGEVERRRQEIQEFVYTLKNPTAAQP